MAYPPAVTRRIVTFGIPFGLSDGADLKMTVTFTPDRSLVWSATGDPGIARTVAANSSQQTTGSINLPVTDQSGWRNSAGAVSVTGGAQAFLYKVQVTFFDLFDQQVGPAIDPFLMALPQGDGSAVDLDLQVPFTGGSGVVVQVPDTWSAQIAAAQAAAVAAQAAATAAAQSASQAGTGSVGGFLSGSMPNPGVNATALDTAIAARVGTTSSTQTAVDARVVAGTAAVGRSGAYSDLTGKPSIPSTPAAVGAEPAGLSTATAASLATTYSALLPVLATTTTAVVPTASATQSYSATSGNLVPTLPALSGLAVGTSFGVKRAESDTSSNTITITTSGSDTFDSTATTLALKVKGELRVLQVASIGGTKYWTVAGGNTPLSALDLRFLATPNTNPSILGQLPVYDSTAAPAGIRWGTSHETVARAIGWAIATDPQFAGGVKWDGSDAAPALQAALDSVKGRGGTVWIPAPPTGVTAGTYLQVGTTLTVWPRTRLAGGSALGARLQAKAGIGGAVLRLTATDGSDPNWHWGQVRDLYIDGNKSAQTAPASVTPTAVAPTGTSVSATITTSAAHGLLPGDPILMSGFTPDIYNTVAFVFSVTDSTHFVVNLATQPGACTVIGSYRKLLVGISLSQAGETSEIANTQVQNCYDHGIVQGWIGTPMKYSSVSLSANGGDGLSLWTDRPVVINGISGDTNAVALLGVHGKVSAGANAVGSVTITGIKAENATSPALILDDYAQGVTVIGGGITLTSGNTSVPCMQRTAKSQVSSLNVIGVNCTPFWSGAGNIFQDFASQGSSVNTANASGGTATFFVESTNSVFAAGRTLSERVFTVGDSATPTFNVTAAGIFELLCGSTVGANRTIAAPTGAPVGQPRGQKITVRIQNSTGAAITTAWNAAFNLCGTWVDPANGKSRVTNFYYNGTNWIEFGRGAADQ